MPSIHADIVKKIKKINNKHWLGFEVHSSQQVIRLVIENFQSCCEEWGAGCTASKEFIGARIQKVGWGKDVITHGGDCKTAVVEITTDQGKFELQVWNNHNGYYPHDIEASWNGYKDQQSL